MGSCGGTGNNDGKMIPLHLPPPTVRREDCLAVKMFASSPQIRRITTHRRYSNALFNALAREAGS